MNVPDLSAYLPKNTKENRKRWAKNARRFVGHSLIVFIGLLFFVWLFLGRSPLNEPDEIVWGVTYSPLASEGFSLDSQEVFEAIVTDLRPEKLRLVAYWNRIENVPGKYDFSGLDEQVKLAEENNIPYIIAVGRRVPRYPECHAPAWVDELPQATQDEATLDFIAKTIERYDDNPNLALWQIENEPFLGSFGICPPPRGDFLAREIRLARQLTDKKIMTTESGELSFWLKASDYPDILGTTLYRRVLIQGTNIAANHVYPAWYYRARSNLVKNIHLNLDEVIVAELQAEPWSNKPIIESEPEDLNRTMNPEVFESNIAFTENVGFPEALLWGVEWWYWEKEVNNNDFYWERARQLFQ